MEQSTDEGLPSLVGRLGDQVSELIDLRISLLKVEVKEDLNGYVSRCAKIAVGGVMASIGFALLNIALAFFVSTLFANTGLTQPIKYALGFIIIGLVYLVGGSSLVFVMKKRLANQGVVPERSVNELEKDRQLVRRMVQG